MKSDRGRPDRRAELRAHLIECVENIRHGYDLDDDGFLAVCRSIGDMPWR